MSYKLDEIIGLLDQVLMRLDRIEKLVDFSDENAPDDVNEAFDHYFGKKVDKPTLSVVKSSENNIVEFKTDE
jgi:hypothetical protein